LFLFDDTNIAGIRSWQIAIIEALITKFKQNKFFGKQSKNPFRLKTSPILLNIDQNILFLKQKQN